MLALHIANTYGRKRPDILVINLHPLASYIAYVYGGVNNGKILRTDSSCRVYYFWNLFPFLLGMVCQFAY
jgi:hypothetical protein